MVQIIPTNPTVNKEDISGFETRHISYAPSVNKDSDLLVVKEYIHLKDGARLPNLRMIRDYQRPFWVSREGRQKEHKDKLQWDSLNNLKEYKCPQWDLANRIHRALNGYGRPRWLDDLLKSPYVYGANIKPQCLVKDEYMSRFPDHIHPTSTVAMLDIETDVIHGTEEPILITVTYKDKIFTGIQRSYLGTTEGSEEFDRKRVERRVTELLERFVKERGIDFEFYFGDDAGDICKRAIEKTHEWQPDFMAIWNLDFDIPKIIKAIEDHGYNVEDVFSDPRVPNAYKRFKYIPGKTVKTMHDGRTTPIPIDRRWPVIDVPASYYWLDAMCLYANLRVANGREESYALDSVLNRNIDMGKLKFEETDHLSKLDWHVEMQKNYKIEYIAYNIFDCIGMELLDEKTGDISSAFAALCDRSDYSDFNSDPMQISDAMHFHCLKHGFVFGTCGGDMGVEDDDLVVKPRHWIVTLAAFLAQDIGLNIIRGLPDHKTMVTIHNADLDIEGTYPSVQEATNACKETTIREIVAIEGLTEKDKRTIGVNLSAGETNACSITELAYQLKSKNDLLEEFLMENG